MHVEFNPINPAELNDTDRTAYYEAFGLARYLSDTQTPQTYSGSKDLLRLVQQRNIGVGTILRFWQTNLSEFNILVPQGLIPRDFNGDPQRIIVPPFTILNKNPMTKRPYTWNIEGYDLLSADLLREIMQTK